MNHFPDWACLESVLVNINGSRRGVGVLVMDRKLNWVFLICIKLCVGSWSLNSDKSSILGECFLVITGSERRSSQIRKVGILNKLCCFSVCFIYGVSYVFKSWRIADMFMSQLLIFNPIKARLSYCGQPGTRPQVLTIIKRIWLHLSSHNNNKRKSKSSD